MTSIQEFLQLVDLGCCRAEARLLLMGFPAVRARLAPLPTPKLSAAVIHVYPALMKNGNDRLLFLALQYGSCAAGDDCPFSHNTFEMSLHPERCVDAAGLPA
jgi:hypothetical protein